MGSRFNGFDWQPSLMEMGVDLKMLVSQKASLNTSWVDTFKTKIDVRNAFSKIMFLRTGELSKTLDASAQVFDHPWYQEAELIHLQIVLDGTLSLQTIERILEEKPTLWTWHDPAVLTGHCVTPMDCFRWVHNCGSCPDLARHKLLDRGINVHVSTDWMVNLIRASQATSELIINKFPFGIDHTKFRIKTDLRRKFGFPEDAIIIGIRAISDTYKNFDFFKTALERVVTDNQVIVLSIGDLGLLEQSSVGKTIEIIEWPWVSKMEELVDYYNLLDLFVSPSRFETFGLMGLEAMACGVPVLGTKFSAVSEVCNLAEYGLEVSPKDINMFANVLEDFMNGLLEPKKTRVEIRNFVLENYSLEDFNSALVNTYESILNQVRL
jgi:glycosyltransferase involved in cell wall biosynthesis